MLSQLVVLPYRLGRVYSGQNQRTELPSSAYLAIHMPVECDSLLGTPKPTYGTVDNSGRRANAAIRILTLRYQNIFISIMCYSIILVLVGYCLSDFMNSSLRQIQLQEDRFAMDEIRRSWARERAEEQKEREQKEEREREEEIRKRSNLLWTELATGGCLRYGVRRYTAILSRVALGLDSVEECWNKTINIHGREWIPAYCEDSVREKNLSKIRS